MKKLVTLMLALSLSGSQVFAAATPQQQTQQSSPAANLAIGGAVAALLLYLVAPQGANSFVSKLSEAFDHFVSGRATPAQCTQLVVNHFAGQATQAGTDMLSSMQSSMLTPQQQLQAQALAAQNGWDAAQTEAAAGQLALQEQSAKVAPMFAILRQLFGSQQQTQQQSAVDAYLANGNYQQAASTIGR